MKFKCEIDNLNTLKKGMKIILYVAQEDVLEVMGTIAPFMNKPLVADLNIDSSEQMKRFLRITPEQRKKIYAILRDMEAYIGDSVENLKESTKASFIRVTEHEDFSLSNCSKELAADYIEYLIIVCFEMGVSLKDSPADAFDDIDRYLYICLDKRVCAVCGATGEVHHVDTIGMGRNRKTVDDSAHRKICLCRGHHTEAHAAGMEAFGDKYHVHGILWVE